MDSSQLLIVCVVGAIVGAIVAGAGVFVGYRLGRQAAITHDGINQAREVRDKLLDGMITEAKLAPFSVTENRLADGAVIENRIADGAVKEPFILKVAGRPIKPN